MILKLTVWNASTVLVDTTGCCFTWNPSEDPYEAFTFVEPSGAVGFRVKETIEEIEQQIKEGGICGTN
jgi:hypothetical protein